MTLIIMGLNVTFGIMTLWYAKKSTWRVIMLSVVMLNVVMISVITPNVVAPVKKCPKVSIKLVKSFRSFRFSGMYYKYITLVNDASSIVSK